MINDLHGILDGSDISLVDMAVNLLFEKPEMFKTPEALILYEQNIMDEGRLFKYCSNNYLKPLDDYPLSYIHKDILDYFKESGVLPLNFIVSSNTLHIGILPELEPKYIRSYKNCEIIIHYLTIYKYVEFHKISYGLPKFLFPRLPMKDLLDFIVNEAINVEASDIVITSGRENARIIYDVRKRWVNSRRYIDKEDVIELGKYIANLAGSPLVEIDRRPKYYGINLNQNYRGRVATSNIIFGKSTTIRVISNDYLKTTFEELNLSNLTIDFMDDIFFSDKPGLRIIIGETSSGKSTTILSGINKKLSGDKIHRGFSIEQPVEMYIEKLDQINCENEDEYLSNMQAMKRHNPDFIYATEMTDTTAKHILKEANEGKCIYSSLHTNSCATAVSRVQDLTGLSTDRIIENINCIVLQELERDDSKDKLYPRNICIEFTEELRFKMFGKTTGEIYKILKEEEDLWLLKDMAE